MSPRFGLIWAFRNPDWARVPWEELYRSHDRLESMGRRGRAVVLESYSLERTAQRYLELYGVKPDRGIAPVLKRY